MVDVYYYYLVELARCGTIYSLIRIFISLLNFFNNPLYV